jgi:hypothetical protein
MFSATDAAFRDDNFRYWYGIIWYGRSVGEKQTNQTGPFVSALSLIGLCYSQLIDRTLIITRVRGTEVLLSVRALNPNVSVAR